MKNGFLSKWNLGKDELDAIMEENPSLRGIVFGYTAEYKLRSILQKNKKVKELHKFSDHDKSHKSDLDFVFNGQAISVEVKSIQTGSVRPIGRWGWAGRAQVDASDCRLIELPNGTSLKTSCLLIGEFDLLAVNCFPFGNKWHYAFARNKDLPRTTAEKFAPKDRKYLLSTSIPVTWPLQAPFEATPWNLIKQIAKEKKNVNR